MRIKRALAITGAVVLVAAAGVSAFAVLSPQAPPQDAPASQSTVAVIRGSMVSETNVPGTLQYSQKQPLTAGLAGVVTELPAPGAQIGAGGVLYRVNTYPAMLLSGTIPAWRDFTRGMDDGEDVRQLEQNLLAFGVFDAEPDARYTWYTAEAVERWQASLGVEQTGSIERSTIVFSGQAVRVDSIESRVGAEVAPGSVLYQSTDPQLIVELNVRSSDRAVAVAGATATVILPTGAKTEGVVQTVGSPVSKKGDDDKSSIVVPVRLTVADQSAVAELALANVTVAFASTMRDDVLTVPVDALVPLDDTEFGVELPRTASGARGTILAVTVGAFASGMVEISGKDIAEGLDVVVPAR